jgi:hypothetical protein
MEIPKHIIPLQRVDQAQNDQTKEEQLNTTKIPKILLDNENFAQLDTIGQMTYLTLAQLPPESITAFRAHIEALEPYHILSKEWTLPFSHWVQLYHLMNISHLEHVHEDTLNNLAIGDVVDTIETQNGGIITFITNIKPSLISLFRKPQNIVSLELLSPFTISLTIPQSPDIQTTVLFNTLPIREDKHVLFVDIYSNLEIPKSILKPAMQLATSLTVMEDIPYYENLAKQDIRNVIRRTKDNPEMYLYKRYSQLYL